MFVQTGIFRMESTCATCKGTGKIVSVWYKSSSVLCHIDSLLYDINDI